MITTAAQLLSERAKWRKVAISSEQIKDYLLKHKDRLIDSYVRFDHSAQGSSRYDKIEGSVLRVDIDKNRDTFTGELKYYPKITVVLQNRRTHSAYFHTMRNLEVEL